MAEILELLPDLLPTGASPLHLAANRKDVDCLTDLLQTDCSLINELDQHGRTPLVVAIKNGWLDAARVLIQYGASLDVKCGEDDQTVLQVLSLPVFHSFVGSLIQQETTLPFTPESLVPLLPRAAWDGNADLLVKLVTQYNVDVNCKDHLQQTALHYACQRGYVECVNLLLQFNADRLATDSRGSTALHMACTAGDIEVVKVVLQVEHGLKDVLNAHNVLNRTPAHVALYSKQYEVLLYILTHFSHHLDLTLADRDGHTLPGLLFTFRCSLGVVPDPYKHTLPCLCKEEATWLLHIGVVQSDLKLCSFSIEQGADVNCFDYMQQSPLLLAAKLGCLEICELLARHGADLNASDTAGKTPLVYASELDRLEVVTFLLSLPEIDLTPFYARHNRAVSNQLLQALLKHFEGNLSAPRPSNWQKLLALAAASATEEAFGQLVEAICPSDWFECLASGDDPSNHLAQVPIPQKQTFLPLYAEEEPDSEAEASFKKMRSASFKAVRKTAKPFECMKKLRASHKSFRKLAPTKAGPFDVGTSRCKFLRQNVTGYRPLCVAVRHGNEAVFSFILSNANSQNSRDKLLALEDGGCSLRLLIAQKIQIFAGALVKLGLYSSLQEKLQEQFSSTNGVTIEEVLIHSTFVPTGDPNHFTKNWPVWYLEQQVSSLCERLGEGPLSLSVERDRKQLMKLILECCGPSLVAATGSYDRLLYTAVHFKCLWAVQLLLAHGASPTAKYKGRYALTEAARQCQVEIIDLLLQEGFSPFLALPELEHLCSSLCPTLVTLANQGFFVPVQKLIDGLPMTDKLWCTRNGPRLLYVLASLKAQDLALSLVQSFLSFFCKSVANWEKASSKSRSDVCMCLKQLQKYVVVFRSVHHREIDLLIELVIYTKLLICNLEVDCLGFIFHTLCRLGKHDLVQLMLENAGDVSSTLVNKLDTQQRSPLFHAAFGGHLEIIHLLMDECCIVYSDSSQPPILALILYFALAQFSDEHLGDNCGKVERSTLNTKICFLEHQLEETPTRLFSHAFQSPEKCEELVQLLMPPDTSILQELLKVTGVKCQGSPVHLLWLISSCRSLQPLEYFLAKVAADTSILSKGVIKTAVQFERPTMWRDNNYTILDDAITLAPTCSDQSSSVSYDLVLARYASVLALNEVKLAARKGYWNVVLEAISKFPDLRLSYALSAPDLLKSFQWVLCHAAKLGRIEILSSVCSTFGNDFVLFEEQCRPLSVAIRHNHLDAVDILVKAGDALDVALEVAVKFGRTDAFKMLLGHVRHDQKGILSQSVEKLACIAGRYNQTNIIKMLLTMYEDTELMIGCEFPERALSFWFLILLEATRHGHENLGLQAVACISETQMKEVAQHIRYKDVLYWCCYWGMLNLLGCVPFTSAQLLKRTHSGTSPWECAIANGHIGKLSHLSNFPEIPDKFDEWLADGPLCASDDASEGGINDYYSVGLLFNGSFHQLCSNAVDSIVPPVSPRQKSVIASDLGPNLHNVPFVTGILFGIPDREFGPNLHMLIRGIVLGIPHVVKTYLKTLGKYAGKIIQLMHQNRLIPPLHLACMTKDSGRVLALLLAALLEADLLNDVIESNASALGGMDGDTPLSVAVRTGSVESAQLLLRCGPASMIHYVHPKTADTLMHLAVRSGDAEMVRLVMKSLGDDAVEHCFIPNKKNEYPLYLAYSLGNCEILPEIAEKGKTFPVMLPDWKQMALRAIGWFDHLMKTSPKPSEYTLFNSNAFSLRKDGLLKDVFHFAVQCGQKDVVAALLFVSGSNLLNAFLPEEPEIVLNSTVFDFCFDEAPFLQRSNILTKIDFTSAVCAFIHKGKHQEVINLLELIQTNNLQLRPEICRVSESDTGRVLTLDITKVFVAACCQKQLEIVQYFMNSTYPPIIATLNRPMILERMTAALERGCLNTAAYLQLESGLAFQKKQLPKGVKLSPLTSYIFFDTRDGYYTVVDQFFESVVVANPTDRLPISAAWIIHNWTEYECQLVMKQLGGYSAPSNPWNMRVADGDGHCTLPISIDWESFHECLLHSPRMDSSCMKYTPLLVEAIVFSPAVLGQMASSDGNPASVNVLELFGSSTSSTPSSLILSCVTWPSEPSTSTSLGGHGLLTLSYMPQEGVFVFPTCTDTATDSFLDTDDSGILTFEYSAQEDTSCYLEYCRDLANSYSKSRIKGYSSLVVDLVGFADVDSSEMFSVVYPALQLVLADCSEVLKLVQRSSVLYSNLQDNTRSGWLKSVCPIVPYKNVAILLSLDVKDSEESPAIKVSLEDKTLTIILRIGMETLADSATPGSVSQFPVLPSYELLLENICSCIVDAEVILLRDKFQSLLSRVVVPKLKKSLKCTSLDADFFVLYLCDKLGNTCRLSEVHTGHLNLMKSFPKFKKFLSLFSEMLHVLSFKPRVHSSVRHLFEGGCKITLNETGKMGMTVKAGVPHLTLSITGVQKGSYQRGLLDMFSTLVAASRTRDIQDISIGLPAPFACHVNLEKCPGLLYPVLGLAGKLTVQLVDYSGLNLSSRPTTNCYLEVAIKTPSLELDVANSSEEPGQRSVSKQLFVKATAENGEFEVEWTPKEEGLHCLSFTVNGIPIDGSPFKAMVAQPDAPPSDRHRRKWFLNKGSCGSRQTFAGSPLVFIASHSGPRCNCRTRPPDIVLPRRKPIRPLPSPAITSDKASPSHSTSSASLESLTCHPLHYITVCAASGSTENWLHVPSGPITLHLARDSLGEGRRSRVKQKKRLRDRLSAHCLPLGNGLYRVSLSCTLACTFKLFTACATCQAVMTIHWIDEKALLPAPCYVLPGSFCNKQSTLSSKRLSRTLSKSSGSKPGTVVDTVPAGSTVTLFLRARDGYGNAHTSGGAVKRAIVEHAAQRDPQRLDAQLCTVKDSECSIIHLGNGDYQLQCQVFTAGNHSIVVTDQYERSEVMGTVKVQDGRPHAPNCRIDPTNTYQAMVSERYECYLYLYDRFFNSCSPAYHSFVEATVGADHLQTFFAPGPLSNRVKLYFTPTSRGIKQLLIKVFAEVVPGCPIDLNIIALTQSFKQKFKNLKTYLVNNHCVGYTPTLTINRENILESAVQTLYDDYFHCIIRVRFGAEPGMDTGGVSREFFHLLCHEFVNPQYALFQCVSGLYRPNPNSSVNPNHLFYFSFLGKLLAKIICDGHQTTVRFTPAVYKYLLQQECTLDDLKIEDPSLHTGLVEILNSDSEEALEQLSVNFTATRAHFGALHTIELECGGEHKMVTMANREEFVHKLHSWHLTGCIKEQLCSLKRGFNLLIPCDQLERFSPHELEVILSGQPVIDLDFIKKNTVLHGYSRSSAIVQWLWEVLESFSQEECCQFLQFTTGCACLPSAATGQWELLIQKGSHDPSLLPVAATCFNALTVPQYPSKAVLRQKLEVAIAYGQQTFLLH